MMVTAGDSTDLTLLKRYIQSLWQVDDTKIDDFVLKVHEYVGGYSVPPAERVDWDNAIQCNLASPQNAMSRVAFETLSGDALDYHLDAIGLFLNQQYNDWASEGENAPSTKFDLAPCYRLPVITLQWDIANTLTELTPGGNRYAIIRSQQSYPDKPNRLFRCSASGLFVDGTGQQRDFFYAYDTQNDVWVYDPLFLQFDGHNVRFQASESDAPFNEAHQYVWTGTVDIDGKLYAESEAPDRFSFGEDATNSNSWLDAATGTITIAFSDLGQEVGA